jgi:CubicO group peptidase (beta-lactamase class C family)
VETLPEPIADPGFLLTIETIQRGIEQGLHSGAQLYVSRRGEALLDLALGEARPGVRMHPTTVMGWLSAGKPITAVAIGILGERGKLHLDTPVAHWIPEFAQLGKRPITLRHLLTHTGGFRPADRLPDKPGTGWYDLIHAICATPLEPGWVPGKKAGYHLSSSWMILGEIVERIDGRPPDRFVREEILEPLGMKHSWLSLDDDQARRYGNGLGVLHATDTAHVRRAAVVLERVAGWPCRPGLSARGPIRDLGRFYEMLLAGGTWTGPGGARQILQPEIVAAFTRRERTGMYDHTFQHVIDWGLGFLVDSNRHGADTVPYGYGRFCSQDTFGHSGAQSSCAFADPAHGVVVAWVCNGTPGEVKHQRRQREINEAVYHDLGLG